MSRLGEWIKVSNRLPEVGMKVLATYINSFGKRRRICASYIPQWTIESSCEYESYDEYSKEKDKYYLREGWYEEIDNWDFSSIFVTEGNVTHWMPLPAPPTDKLMEGK